MAKRKSRADPKLPVEQLIILGEFDVESVYFLTRFFSRNIFIRKFAEFEINDPNTLALVRRA